MSNDDDHESHAICIEKYNDLPAKQNDQAWIIWRALYLKHQDMA